MSKRRRGTVEEDPSDQLSSAFCVNIEVMKVKEDSFPTASVEQEDEEARYFFYIPSNTLTSNFEKTSTFRIQKRRKL
jgi:hypothetical protein